MSLRWQCVCVDSRSPSQTARFWEQALGWRVTEEAEDEVVLGPPAPGSRRWARRGSTSARLTA